MTGNGVTQIILYLVLLIACAVPLGIYMYKVYERKKTFLDFICRPIERAIYKVTRIKEDREMNWKQYAVSLLLFNLVGLVFLYVLLRLQGHLPLNPQHLGTVSRPLAFNTAASFVAHTNWQSYAGESTMSYLSQMLGLTVQNFLAAATGMCVIIPLLRGIARKRTDKIGNFWVDMTRSLVWILIPLSIVGAVFFMWQGSTQNLSPYKKVTTLESQDQTIAMGPTASQESIKMVGNNGGGFFNANSSHPYENPTPLSNAFQMLFMLLIPVALCFTLGKYVGDWKQGLVIFLAMLVLFVAGIVGIYWAETSGNPRIAKIGVTSPNTMEGKETRFGEAQTAYFANGCTATSTGATTSSHDSFTPLAGLIPMWNIQLGEVIFGGLGTGLAGMLVFLILTLFIIGLMVGRTPEYLGKKLESWEVKMAMVVILVPTICILFGTAIAAAGKFGTSSVANPGPHGFSEILYAFTSASGNNGSAMAGLNANTGFYNVALGIAMLVGRFLPIVAALAIAGSLAKKQPGVITEGSFRTDRPMFPIMLDAVVLIVGALSFFVVLSLGPIIEKLLM
jgi:K+-transporting ATPase ATPase A chain